MIFKDIKEKFPRLRKTAEFLIRPNILTLYRVLAVPAIILLLLPNKKPLFMFLAAVMFSLAAITDYLDGYLARTRGLESKMGKIMDPLADKILVSSSLIMLTWHRIIPAWMVCIIIGRELAVTSLRTVIADNGKDVSASILGKYKTGFQIAATIPLLIHYKYLWIDFHSVGFFFLVCALIMTLWSGIDYFLKFRKLFRD